MRKYLAISIILLTAACLFSACATENITPLLPQEAPLLPPQNFVTSRTEGGDILLAWEPSTQINLLGYNIYRSNYREDSFSRINPAPVLEAGYRDETASANTRYEYRVACVGMDQRESGYGIATIYNGSTAGGEKEKKLKF
jgi:hypothetical protein